MAETGWSLMIHGGAGIVTREVLSAAQDAGARAGLAQALDAGSAVLDGGSALDAVQAAVRVLEDDPHFNAGRGAVLTHDGHVALDAAIMDGATRAAGAVAAVTVPRNPVALARRVMTDGRHVMLSGAGADTFALQQDIEVAAPGWFEIPERRAQLAELLARGGDGFDVDMKYGTVGAVARDAHGHVAAATSTGGVTGKRWGRIGDSPLIGAGTYADDRACAVSATGSGEVFIRLAVAHEIGARMRMLHEPAQVAADAVMAEVRALGGSGGVIVMPAAGVAVWSFTTPGMYRAVAGADGTRTIAIYADERT